jgi:diguanylate cyclase (GGDEF)-like protein
VRRGDLAAVVLLDARGRELARSGAADAAAFASVDVRQGSRRLGTLLASGITAESYLREVHRLTGQEGVLVRGGQPVGATGALAETDIPLSGDVTVAGRELRARTASISGPTDAGGSLTLTLLGPRESAGAVGSEPLVAGVLLAFFALALVLVLPLLRDLGRLHERVAGQAVTDELTGLSNQRRFRELMRKEVGRANRFDRPLSLLMIDIDDFKGVNDTHGHLQGDRVLEAVAGVLRAESRDVDEPARYGGEEFALALPETPVEGAMLLAERIRARVEALRVPLGRQGELAVTVSVGVAGTPGGPPGDSDGLIAAADQALYAAKRAGKNRAEADAHSAPSTI